VEYGERIQIVCSRFLPYIPPIFHLYVMAIHGSCLLTPARRRRIERAFQQWITRMHRMHRLRAELRDPYTIIGWTNTLHGGVPLHLQSNNVWLLVATKANDPNSVSVLWVSSSTVLRQKGGNAVTEVVILQKLNAALLYALPCVSNQLYCNLVASVREFILLLLLPLSQHGIPAKLVVSTQVYSLELS
jgi:hypothetical protein